MFTREAVLWRQLSHEHLLPFLGVSENFRGFCLVSPWMSGGSAASYVRRNNLPSEDRLRLVRAIMFSGRYED
jgi:serine/threonine protein kinase